MSLSTSPADEEYFLSSRRFWNKEELSEAGTFGPQSSPPRRPLAIPGRGGRRSNAAPTLGRSSSSGVFEQGGTQRGKTGYKGWVGRSTNSGGRARAGDGEGAGGDGGGGGGLTSGANSDPEHWDSRPEEWGGQWIEGQSAALSCLSAADVERLLENESPLPATTVVCAAIVFLLAPDNQLPQDFCWPRGFETVARPTDEFLRRLNEVSGTTVSSFKARVLRVLLQKEEFLPAAIERQGGHAVAR